MSEIRHLRALQAFDAAATNASLTKSAEVLGVTHVLEGSVWRSGDRLRITAQLVDAARGFNAWSNRYDRAAGDLFAVQDDIARSIVDELPVGAASEPLQTVLRPDTGVDAYDLYLLAREKWSTNTQENFQELAQKHFPILQCRLEEVALQLDKAYWVKDDNFSTSYHISRVALPSPRNWESVYALFGQFHAQPLDKSRPLWQ